MGLVPPIVTSIVIIILTTLHCLVISEAEETEGGSEEEEVCFNNTLGCFPIGDPWTSILRLGYLPPQSPEVVNTSLAFFSRTQGSGTVVRLWPEISLKEADFVPYRKRTFFITHGYNSNGNVSWIVEMTVSLLRKLDANVFVTSWHQSISPGYFQDASNTRIVGAELSRFIQHLVKNCSLDPKNVHLIGHSLGAHISGYAAKDVPGIGRVTGLDAAQPGFEGTTSTVRIDKTDAEFVDLLHTNGKPLFPTIGLGMISPVGDVDIYVNGGLDQPDCILPDSVRYSSFSDLGNATFSIIEKWISCSHSKAHAYFQSSINSRCKLWARQADTLRTLLNAMSFGAFEPILGAAVSCTITTCTVIGLDTPLYPARGVFAAVTSRNAPYCDDYDGYDDKIHNQMKMEVPLPKIKIRGL